MPPEHIKQTLCDEIKFLSLHNTESFITVILLLWHVYLKSLELDKWLQDVNL